MWENTRIWLGSPESEGFGGWLGRQLIAIHSFMHVLCVGT
jgi:hypothetical protein